jgi:hypothetical protein
MRLYRWWLGEVLLLLLLLSRRCRSQHGFCRVKYGIKVCCCGEQGEAEKSITECQQYSWAVGRISGEGRKEGRKE